MSRRFSYGPIHKGRCCAPELESSNWLRILRKGLGLIGQQLENRPLCNWSGPFLQVCKGENFLEVDINIGSSGFSNATVHLAFGYITSLTVDSQTEEELPEKILRAFRLSELSPDPAHLCEPSSDATVPTSPTAGMRLWMSLGQGFSNLLHPGTDEVSAVSDTSQVNGTSNQDEKNEIAMNLHVPSFLRL